MANQLSLAVVSNNKTISFISHRHRNWLILFSTERHRNTAVFSTERDRNTAVFLRNELRLCSGPCCQTERPWVFITRKCQSCCYLNFNIRLGHKARLAFHEPTPFEIEILTFSVARMMCVRYRGLLGSRITLTCRSCWQQRPSSTLRTLRWQQGYEDTCQQTLIA